MTHYGLSIAEGWGFSTTFDTKPNIQMHENVLYEALNPLSCITLMISIPIRSFWVRLLSNSFAFLLGFCVVGKMQFLNHEHR
ncbi:MAG: hypothetical protein JSS64_06480 [Bacteroidetes bacterium]|nr:hypothetical protein [Bacteroidota bacterium]